MSRFDFENLHECGIINHLDLKCVNCGKSGMSIFYEASGIPVQSAYLMPTREKALKSALGKIALGICRSCGLIYNTEYNHSANPHFQKKEKTDAFSFAYNSFIQELAEIFITKYSLFNKKISALGAKSDDFLSALCEMGGNTGQIVEQLDLKEFNKDTDCVVSAMTLGNIYNGADLLSTLRSCLSERTNTILFYIVRDVERILTELAYWEISHEDCTYFSLGSLARLFRKSGFDIIEIKKYKGQFITLAAKPSMTKTASNTNDDMGDLLGKVKYFAENHLQKLLIWKQRIADFRRSGYRVVLWKAGAKSAAFLNLLDMEDGIKYVVDINTHLHGAYIPGTGHKIISPAHLREYRPDAIIALNPLFNTEVSNEIKRLGLTAELLTF
ncbi:MAG: methyltransferase domain-containing protein [Deltaproteobacteria bacterium]|nr:methyltransferase domain-containing protein [Deltaproteobacteria bacterium]